MARPTYEMELIRHEMLALQTLPSLSSNDTVHLSGGAVYLDSKFAHEGELVKRSYSIASTPEQLAATGELEIAVGLIDGGKASTALQQAPIGQIFEMSSPLACSPCRHWPRLPRSD